MDENIISVIVESLPSDIYSQVLPWATGIILPISLFFISKIFANIAEKNANNFTIELHKTERIHLQQNRALDLLHKIYKITHSLKLISVRVKSNQEYKKSLINKNTKIMESKNEQDISEHKENLRVSSNKNEKLSDLQAKDFIEIYSFIGVLSYIIGDKKTSNLSGKIENLTTIFKNNEDISEEDTASIIKEINLLSNNILKGEIKVFSA